MEGALSGGRFPLNECLGFAILHCNCCVREVDCFQRLIYFKFNGSVEAFEGLVQLFLLDFSSSNEDTTICKAVCVYMPTFHLHPTRDKPPSMDFMSWKPFMVSHLNVLVIIYLFSDMIHIILYRYTYIYIYIERERERDSSDQCKRICITKLNCCNAKNKQRKSTCVYLVQMCLDLVAAKCAISMSFYLKEPWQSKM